MKLTVKKCLFAAFIMSASVSLPNWPNGQWGQGQAAFNSNDSVIQALSFYQCANTLLSAGQSLCKAVKPLLGLEADLPENGVQNPWTKRMNEDSYHYAWRLLRTVTKVYGDSIDATEKASKFAQYAKNRTLYGADFLPDVGGQNSSRQDAPDAWSNVKEVRAEKRDLAKDLEKLKACKTSGEQKKAYYAVMKKWAEDKVTASGDKKKVARYSAYQQKIVEVGEKMRINKKPKQGYEESR